MSSNDKNYNDISDILQQMNNEYDNNMPANQGNPLEGDDDEDIVDMNYLLENNSDFGAKDISQIADDQQQMPQMLSGAKKSKSLAQNSNSAKMSQGKKQSFQIDGRSNKNQNETFSHQKETGGKQKIRVYDKMENDPMLMLEQDDDFGLRVAKGHSKKANDINQLEKELLRERDEAKRPAYQLSDQNFSQNSSSKHNFVSDNSRNDSKMEDLSINQNQSSFMKENNGDGNDLEQLDQILEQLSFDIQAMGLPDCGNLRSTKRKDVKLRIKCLQILMRQRKKDQDFKDHFNERQKKSSLDSEALQDKIRSKDLKIKSIDQDRAQLRNQIKEKEQEVQSIRNQQKTAIKDKQATHVQVEQKLVRSECEVKKQKIMVQKLQDQLKRQMDKNLGAVGLDINDRILDLGINGNLDGNTKAGQNRIGMEFKEMTSNGNSKLTEMLQEENKVLKQQLLSFQEHLSQTIEDALKPIHQVLNSKELHQQFNYIVANHRVTAHISQMQLNLPQSPASSMNIVNVQKENLEKFRRFTQQILNPSSIAQFILNNNTMIAEKLQKVPQIQIGQIGTLNLNVQMCGNDSDNAQNAYTAGQQRVTGGAGIQANQRKNTRSQNRAGWGDRSLSKNRNGWGDRRSNSPNAKIGGRQNIDTNTGTILEAPGEDTESPNIFNCKNKVIKEADMYDEYTERESAIKRDLRGLDDD